MATRYASLARPRCSDLPERDVIAALISKDECALLLFRLADRSASRALFTLMSRLATPACIWLEGDLAVELFQEEAVTKIRVMSDIGGGLRERVLPVVTIAQPLDELVATFEAAFERARDLTVLRLERVSSRCAFVLASEESAPVSGSFDISETSLAWASGAGAAPEEVDSGWDA